MAKTIEKKKTYFVKKKNLFSVNIKINKTLDF